MNDQLRKQINRSSVELTRLKKIVPYIFPEYVALMQAEVEYATAKKKLGEAKAAWKMLGNPTNEA